MTVGELRELLKHVPAALPVCISFTDFENDGYAYATLDVRFGGVQDAAAEVLTNLPAEVPLDVNLPALERDHETRVVRRGGGQSPDMGHAAQCVVLAAWGGI